MSDSTDEGKDQRALDHAIETGDVNTVRTMLAKGVKPSSGAMFEGDRADFPEVTKELIKAGLIDINADLDMYGDLLLMAVIEHNAEFAKWLLENGANPNSEFVAQGSLTALCAAAEEGQIDLVQLLIDHGARLAGNQTLPAAAENGEFKMVRFLIEQGADIDEVGVHDWLDERKIVNEGAALHKAAERGDIDLAAFLLEKGAQLELRDPKDRTPLMRAMEKNQEAMVRFLESKK